MQGRWQTNFYLGAGMAEHGSRGADSTVHKFCLMSVEQYLKLAIQTVEDQQGDSFNFGKAVQRREDACGIWLWSRVGRN